MQCRCGDANPTAVIVRAHVLGIIILEESLNRPLIFNSLTSKRFSQ